jgi:hypothetical protein
MKAQARELAYDFEANPFVGPGDECDSMFLSHWEQSGCALHFAIWKPGGQEWKELERPERRTGKMQPAPDSFFGFVTFAQNDKFKISHSDGLAQGKLAGTTKQIMRRDELIPPTLAKRQTVGSPATDIASI